MLRDRVLIGGQPWPRGPRLRLPLVDNLRQADVAELRPRVSSSGRAANMYGHREATTASEEAFCAAAGPHFDLSA